MCGIAGVITAELSPAQRREAVGLMCDAMVHRGPDDVGVEDLGDACIGIRRLAILDTSASGHQPMCNEDGSVTVVFNGEIYNFQDLRETLLKQGHVFRSNSDTESIVHLYEEHGAAMCDQLRGMFAFGIWDARERSLLLVRDRLGIKPVYYAEVRGGWAFASEVGAFLASGLVAADLDYASLDQYITFGVVPPPGTLFRGVNVLLPGHRARFVGGRCLVEQWWSIPDQGTNPVPQGEVVSGVRHLLEESTRLHCLSDVPVGAFLSGGIDSTAVVGLMARQSGTQVRTFSLGFEESPPGLDERSAARATAQALGTDHTEIVINGDSVRDALGHVVQHVDQPSFDGLNTHLISRVAKSGGLTVALSGLGGDEIFGGYGTYHRVPRWAPVSRVWGDIPRPVRARLTSAFGGSWGGMGLSAAQTRKISRLRRVDSSVGLYALARLLIWPEEKKTLYSKALVDELSKRETRHAIDLLAEVANGADNSWSMVTQLKMQTYMGWCLLRDTDVMSMAHSLETRAPLIDHKLVESVCGLAPGWENTWGHPKRLLTESLADVLPKAVLSRKKQGFTFPMDLWMKGPLSEAVEDTLSADSLNRRGLLSPTGIGDLVRSFQEGRLAYSAAWQMVVLELWMREKLDRAPSPAVV